MRPRIASIPAVCDVCHTVFPTGFAIGENAATTFENCRAGPCPVCGGYGSVMEGTFTLIGDALRFLAKDASADEVRRLREHALRARDTDASSTDFANAVSGDPSLAGFGEWIKSVTAIKTPSEFYAFIGMLLSVLSIILPMLTQQSPPPSISEKQIADISAKAAALTYAEIQRKAPHAGSAEPHAKPKPHVSKKKAGRNNPCPCGSGKKYKHCCL